MHHFHGLEASHLSLPHKLPIQQRPSPSPSPFPFPTYSVVKFNPPPPPSPAQPRFPPLYSLTDDSLCNNNFKLVAAMFVASAQPSSLDRSSLQLWPSPWPREFMALQAGREGRAGQKEEGRLPVTHPSSPVTARRHLLPFMALMLRPSCSACGYSCKLAMAVLTLKVTKYHTSGLS